MGPTTRGSALQGMVAGKVGQKSTPKIVTKLKSASCGSMCLRTRFPKKLDSQDILQNAFRSGWESAEQLVCRAKTSTHESTSKVGVRKFPIDKRVEHINSSSTKFPSTADKFLEEPAKMRKRAPSSQVSYAKKVISSESKKPKSNPVTEKFSEVKAKDMRASKTAEAPKNSTKRSSSLSKIVTRKAVVNSSIQSTSAVTKKVAAKKSVKSLSAKKKPMLTKTMLKKLKGRPLTVREINRFKKRPLTSAELKKLGPIEPRKPRLKEFAFKGSDWDGNSDDEGSVDFALLDEDLCYECGLDTSDETNWSKLIICDACDGEYHMACVKLDRVPRNGYVCPRCYREDEEFAKLKFNVSDHFEIPRRKKDYVFSRCYSPSRPLHVAFEECKRKGFMLISHLFSYELMRQLTHGVIQKQTNSGRVADCWEGATMEISKRLTDSSHNLVDRQGRYDMRIPEFVVEELKLEKVLEPLLVHLRSIMTVGKKPPVLRTHNIVFVPVGSKEQIWHVDDCVRKGGQHRYFTILIQLNMIDEKCGGTEVWSKDLYRGDLIRGRPGDAFVFPGSLLHRGRGNEGYSHRFFYYASFSAATDENSY